MNKLNEHKDDQKEIREDDAIKEALSGLGWIEEKDSEGSIEEITEQAQIIERLNKKILELQKKNQELDALLKVDGQSRDIEKTKEEASTKISHLQARVDALKAEKDEFMFKLGESMNQKEEIIRTYEMQIEQLKAQNQALLNRTALNQSFDDEIAIITAEKQELVRENTHLREENTLRNSKIKELETLNNQYHGELVQIKSDAEVKSSRFKGLVEELEGYKNEFVNLKNKIVELERNNQKLAEELSQKQFQMSEEATQIVSYKEMVANKDAVISDLQNQVEEYSEQIQYMEADTVKRSDFEELRAIISNKDDVITIKEKMIFDLEKKIDELRRYSEDNDSLIKELKQQLLEKGQEGSELDKLQNEIQILSHTVADQEQQKKVLYEQVRKLREKETGDEAIIERLEHQIEEMRSSVIKDNLELETLRKENATRIQELNELRTELEKKEKLDGKINRRLQEMKETHEKEINALHDEINEHKKRIKILRRDLSRKG